MTRADELWLAMTFWVVRIVHWSSNSQCVSHSAAFCHNLSCQDTDVFSTTCWGQKGIWQTQLATNSYLGSEPWYRCVYRVQADKPGLRITRNNQLWPIRYIRRVAQTGRKPTTTPRRVSNQKEQPRQRGQIDKLDYTSICASHPNILPILSRDCHTTQQVTVWSV